MQFSLRLPVLFPDYLHSCQVTGTEHDIFWYWHRSAQDVLNAWFSLEQSSIRKVEPLLRFDVALFV